MLSSARARGLERAIASSSSISIPSFLVPAFHVAPLRAFSATTSSQSQIGRAPLSIPPEVNFSIIQPVESRNDRALGVSPRPIASIEGPLGKGSYLNFEDYTHTLSGKLTMTIPPHVHLEHDAAARKAFVKIDDREVRKQREMWGMLRPMVNALRPPSDL